MVGPQSFLSYRRFYYLKWALGLLVASVIAYVYYYARIETVERPSGGSAFGYALGGFCAALALWLAWFGIRKRSYASSAGSLRGWLSAHVYLGSLLLFLVPLHSGFQLGWNVHSLPYGLMVGVILSGLVGVGLYATLPARMTQNRPGKKLETWLEQIADVDGEIRAIAGQLPDYFARLGHLAIEETRIGGGLRRQLAPQDPSCGTTRALAELEARREHQSEWQRLTTASARDAVDRLVKLLALKHGILERVRLDIRYKAALDLWLLFHVPLSIAALAALFIHVFVVFYYW